MIKDYENKDMAKREIQIENKSKVDLHGLRPGEKKKINVDPNGVPLDYHWRRRMKDALIDGSIEVVPEEKTESSSDKKIKKNKKEG